MAVSRRRADPALLEAGHRSERLWWCWGPGTSIRRGNRSWLRAMLSSSARPESFFASGTGGCHVSGQLTSVAREAREQLERADPQDSAAVGAWDGMRDLSPGAAASAQHRQLHFRAVKSPIREFVQSTSTARRSKMLCCCRSAGQQEQDRCEAKGGRQRIHPVVQTSQQQLG